MQIFNFLSSDFAMALIVGRISRKAVEAAVPETIEAETVEAVCMALILLILSKGLWDSHECPLDWLRCDVFRL